MYTLFLIICFFFFIRLVTLGFSVANERKLLKKGAVQYGKFNSLLLTILHIMFYISSVTEASLSTFELDKTSVSGLCILTYSYCMLLYVIYKLKDVWTLKIYIVPGHRLENGWLFRTFKHPNYFLNIIPELLGISILCKGWYTLSLIGPIYLLVLCIRIRQEERAMAQVYKSNKSQTGNNLSSNL